MLLDVTEYYAEYFFQLRSIAGTCYTPPIFAPSLSAVNEPTVAAGTSDVAGSLAGGMPATGTFLQFILYANIYKILILASFIHAAVAQGTSAGGGGGGDK
jgi:hypothetical protein